MEQETLQPRKKLFLLFWAYLKAMLFAFTGGNVTLPILQQQLDDKYHLIEKDKVLEYFALGQTLPGVISLNAGILVGRHVSGWAGALAVSAGIIFPAFFGMLLIAVSYTLLSGIQWIQGAIGGIRAASVAIIAVNAITVIGSSAKSKFAVGSTAAAFLSTLFFGLSILWAILLCGAAGLVYTFIRHRGGRS